MKKRTNIIVIIVLAIILLLEIVLVKLGVFNTIDNFIYSHASKIINNTNTLIFRGFSVLGTEIFILFFCLICIILNKSRGVAISVVVLASTLLNQVLKIIVRRPRPNINPLAVENSFSFPSGHTMIMVVIGGILIYLLWQKMGDNAKCNTKCIARNVILTVIICLIAITVMFSRIYLGVHYFSDIIGGITSGLLFLFISYYYYTFKFKVPYYPGKRK